MELGDFPSYKPPFSPGIFQPAMFDYLVGYLQQDCGYWDDMDTVRALSRINFVVFSQLVGLELPRGHIKLDFHCRTGASYPFNKSRIM